MVKNRMTRLAGICGILIPIVVFFNIGIAMLYSPWFNWTDHALSDLGVEGISALFFNTGMIIGGILAFGFSLGMIRLMENKIGAYTLTLSSLALIGIGIFPETIFTIHFFVSAAFFILLVISLLLIGLTTRKNQSERTLGIIAIIIAIVAICSIVFLLPWEGIAISETLSCFPAFLWCMMYGIKMAVI